MARDSSKAQTSNPPLNLWLPLLIPAIHTNPSPQTPSPLLFCLGPYSLGTKESFQMETLFLLRQEEGLFYLFIYFLEVGGVSSWGGFLGSVLKPVFVWENGASSSHTRPVLINCASGALTWQWVGGFGGVVSHAVWVCQLCVTGSGVSVFTEDINCILSIYCAGPMQVKKPTLLYQTLAFLW